MSLNVTLCNSLQLKTTLIAPLSLQAVFTSHRKKSIYSSGDAFGEIEKEFLEYSGNRNTYGLICEFNAKTSTLSDFIELNDDVDEEIREILFDHQNLSDVNIPLQIYSEDKGPVSTFGLKLRFS